MPKFLAALAVMMSLPAWCLAAENVRLSTADGTYQINGELISFDEGYFRIRTEHGTLTVDGGDVSCAGAACPPHEELVATAVVGGSEDMIHRLMPPLLESFARSRTLSYRHIFSSDTEVAWELSDPDSGLLVARITGRVESDEDALTLLASRKADLSLGRREGSTGAERDVIALDALVPVVSIDNEHVQITLSQFERLLTGEIRDWSQIGGPPRNVSLHLPDNPEVARLLERVFPDLRMKDGLRYASAKELTAAVSENAGALGLAPLSRIGNTVPMVITGSCGLASPATLARIKAEDYPLTQPLFLHRNGARQPRLIRDFIAYSRSHQAQPVIRAAGFTDQGISEIPFERQGDRIANAVVAAGDDTERMIEVQRMVSALLGAKRLSLTFRFRDGSSDLDAQSSSNIRRLSDSVRRGDFAGRELVLVGFTDGEGPADGNLRLSQRRANSVHRAVRSYLGDEEIALSVDGFGEILPMACDDTEWGRQVNRRVEVWVRDIRDQEER